MPWTNLLNVNGRESAKRHETLRGLEGLVFFRDFVDEEQREQWEKEAIEVVKKQSMGGKVPKIRIFDDMHHLRKALLQENVWA
jgi:hypothetical protein